MTAGSSPSALLQLASAVADGTHPMPGISQTRAACLIARQALEQVVSALIAGTQLDCPDASMRIRLICLAAAYQDHDEPVAYRADSAWRRLSTACHHHAYELSPSVGETAALIGEVQWLEEMGLRPDKSNSDLRPMP